MTRRSRPASCRGLSGITVTMVVQLGQATMPRWPARAAAFTSGTTSGTVVSMRLALDLSMTTAPAFTARGASSFDCPEPAEKNAMSTPLKASAPAFSTRMVSPLNAIVLPTDRSEAKTRSAFTGNLRSSRSLSVVCPTAPVTPTTAIVCPEAMSSTLSCRSRVRPLHFTSDQVAHLLGPHQLHACGVDVARAMFLLENAQHRRVDPVRVLAHVERVPQQHPRREDGRDGIGHALPRNVGGGAVHRLVEGDAAPQARRGQHAHGAGEDGRLVRKDVPEGVLRHDGVEVRRLVHEGHGAAVHEHVLELHLRILLAHARHHLAPELRDDEDVGLVHGGEPLPPLHGHVEGDAGHPLDFPRGVGHGVDGPRAAVCELLPAPRLAEVEATRELSDDHDVGVLHHLALEWRGVHQHGEAGCRPQVGEEIELLAQAEEATLGPLLLGQVVPLGPAHRAEQDGVAPRAEGEGGGRERLAGGVDGSAADDGGLELEGDASRASHYLEYLARLGRHFLSDAVSSQDRDLVRRHQAGLRAAAGRVAMDDLTRSFRRLAPAPTADASTGDGWGRSAGRARRG